MAFTCHQGQLAELLEIWSWLETVLVLQPQEGFSGEHRNVPRSWGQNGGVFMTTLPPLRGTGGISCVGWLGWDHARCPCLPLVLSSSAHLPAALRSSSPLNPYEPRKYSPGESPPRAGGFGPTVPNPLFFPHFPASCPKHGVWEGDKGCPRRAGPVAVPSLRALSCVHPSAGRPGCLINP